MSEYRINNTDHETTTIITTKVVNQLKTQIDFLLIRVNSCQQFIQKIFSIIDPNGGGIFSPTKINKNNKNKSFIKNNSNQQQQKQSPSKILLTKISQNSNCKKLFLTNIDDHSHSKQISNNNLSNNILSKTINSYEADSKNNINATQLPSIKDFLLIPTSKQMKNKHIETNSFTLMKNSIMINSHQIQNLQEQFKKVNQNIDIRCKKTEQIIQLLTKVVYQLQEQVRNKFSMLMAVGSQKKNREKSKMKKNYNCQDLFSM